MHCLCSFVTFHANPLLERSNFCVPNHCLTNWYWGYIGYYLELKKDSLFGVIVGLLIIYCSSLALLHLCKMLVSLLCPSQIIYSCNLNVYFVVGLVLELNE